MGMSEEEKDALSKRAYQEVINIVSEMLGEKIENLKDFLDSKHMSKAECQASHKFQDERYASTITKVFICIGLSIFAIFISGWAVGMKIVEVIAMLK